GGEQRAAAAAGRKRPKRSPRSGERRRRRARRSSRALKSLQENPCFHAAPFGPTAEIGSVKTRTCSASDPPKPAGRVPRNSFSVYPSPPQEKRLPANLRPAPVPQQT